MILALAALWGGVWWRLRGGALTALTGWPGPGSTGLTRAICAVGMGSPLMALGWHYAIMMPALWLVWSLAGWGAFQSMGTSPIEEKNPVAKLLEKLGVTDPTCNDLAGMAIEGVLILAALGLVPAAITHHWLLYPAIPALGVWFALLYFIPQRIFTPPIPIPRFADGGSEWAELLVGAWVAFVLVWAARH